MSFPVSNITLPFFLKEAKVPVYRQKGLELGVGVPVGEIDIDLLINSSTKENWISHG